MPLSDAYVDFIAGWASGAVSVVALQPVDTVLTRRQAGLVMASGRYHHLDVRSLWRGSSPMISAVPLQNAILMGGYGLGQQWAAATQANNNNNNKLTPIFVGGCTGGILQSFLMSPVELVKVSQQCHFSPSSTTTTMMTRVWQQPWRGLSATLLRDGIPHGVWFVAYEVSKDQLTPVLGDNVAVPLTSGALAASVAWLVGYPADIIKTRQQAAEHGRLSIMETARELVREADGNVVRGLYRGFGLKLLRAVPASMIGFSVYELVKNQLV